MKGITYMKLQSTLPALVLSAASMLPFAATAEAPLSEYGEFAGSIGLYSDYVYRGVSQTAEDPALQGNLDFLFNNGLKIGVWGSNVRFTDASLELDVYATYKHAWDALNIEGGLVYYHYPGAASSLDYDFFEPFVALGYDFGFASLTGSVAYSPDFFAGSGDAQYYKLAAAVPLPSDFTIDGWYGMQDVDDNATFALPDYDDWSVGVAYSGWAPATLAVRYTDTDIGTAACADGCDARVLASATWAF